MAAAPLRAAFFGTSEFALPTLGALHDSGHAVASVYTQPPRPAGRGRRLRPTPVETRARELGLPVRTPSTLRNTEEIESLQAMELDVGVVAAYGLLLPAPVLRAFRLGCVNVHASLLPRWRGAAPVERAIMAGDRVTGISLMLMDEGLDTGPVLDQCEVPIEPSTTGGELQETLAVCGGQRLPAVLARLNAGSVAPVPQAGGACYAGKLTTEDRLLDWTMTAEQLERRVRALQPVPGARAYLPLGGRPEPVKVCRARTVEASSERPGTVLDGQLTVACAEGALQLLEVQRPGGRALPADAFLRGAPISVGTQLPTPADTEE